ncbi:hypothetical protein D3C87_263780 [compost metagenome]
MKNTTIIKNLKLVHGLFILIIAIFFIYENRRFYLFTPEALGKYIDVKWVIISHIFCGSVALLSGPLLLWEYFRNRFLKIHRLLGKMYVIAILISGLGALYLTFTTGLQVNLTYSFALQIQIFAWLTSTGLAYWAVRKRKMIQHKEWMARSYIITLAFLAQVMLFKIPFIAALGFAEFFPTVVWFSWSVPLFLYQLDLSRQQKK